VDKISPIKERILQFIEYKGIAKTDFCKKTGISYANMKGKSLFSEIGGGQIGEIISTFPQISAEWLLTGKGEMLKSDSLEVKKEVISSAEERVDRLLSIIESQQEVIKNLSEALIEADAQKECDAECADVG